MSGSGGPLVFPACDSDVKILGSDTLEMEQVTITTGAAQVMIASSPSKRNGVSIRNHNAIGGATLYIAETMAKASAAAGSKSWPITAQGGITISISEGVTIYATGDTGSVDVRLIFTGD